MSGKDNILADYLSRSLDIKREEEAVESEVLAVVSPEENLLKDLSLKIISREQEAILNVNKLPEWEKYLEPGEIFTTKVAGEVDETFTVVGVQDNNLNCFKPYLPENLRFISYHILHDTIHQGPQKSFELVAAKYFWPNMKADIKRWVQSCPKCQQCKVSRHNRMNLQCFPFNPRRMSNIHIDLIGPLPETLEGHRYVVAIRDRGTGFLVTSAIYNKHSSTVLSAFRSSFISIFGVPSVIVTDNGGEFRSFEFDEFCSQLGIQHNYTTAYHPQANGLVERTNKIIKVAFRALDDQRQWADILPLVNLFINNQICDTNLYTPHQMLYGQAAILPGEFYFRNETNTTDRALLNPLQELHIYFENMRQFHRTARPQEVPNPYFDTNLYTIPDVLIRNDGKKSSLARKYVGPYRVVSRSRKYFTLYTDAGLQNVTVDRLKPFYRMNSHDDRHDGRHDDHHFNLRQNPTRKTCNC